MSDSRKRDDKRFFKELKAAEKPEDKSKATKALWKDIVDRYSGVLIRQLIDPKTWVHAEFPADDPDSAFVLKMMVQGKWMHMREYYKNAQELMTPDQKWEAEQETLQRYVQDHGTT